MPNMFLYRLYFSLPASWRLKLKQALGALGHGKSSMDRFKAEHDALGKKRLDRSLKHIREVLSACGVTSIEGLRCLEFGSGYVPSDAISLWLLGARHVTSLDYNPIANLHFLKVAIARADFASIRSQLSEPQLRGASLERVDRLELMIRRGKLDIDAIDWSYSAPVDVTDASARLPTYDFIWSTNVLEHIARSMLPAVLKRLQSVLSPGGFCVHHVDLRDHLDFDNNPYGFLDRSKPFDPDADADARGNGMTADDWNALFAGNPDLDLRILAHVKGRPDLVPLDPATGRRYLESVDDFITVGNVRSAV